MDMVSLLKHAGRRLRRMCHMFCGTCAVIMAARHPRASNALCPILQVLYHAGKSAQNRQSNAPPARTGGAEDRYELWQGELAVERMCLQRLEDGGDALASANAERGRAIFEVVAPQLRDEREGEA